MKLSLPRLTQLLLAVGLCSSAHAASIVVEADDDNGFSFANGIDLAVGNLVRVGFFDITDSQIQANQFDLGFLNSHFFEFGAAHIGDTYGVDGHLASPITRNTAGGSVFDNKQIALWVFGSNNPSSADTFASISAKGINQQGIFFANQATTPSWRIRSEAEIPSATTIDLSDLTNAAGTALTPGAHVVLGSFPTGVSDALGGPNFGLVAVPEPSSAILALLGGTAFLVRRRRK